MKCFCEQSVDKTLKQTVIHEVVDGTQDERWNVTLQEVNKGMPCQGHKKLDSQGDVEQKIDSRILR